MELYQIRYFLAAADTLNFTRASERSCISQPALTKAIQRLEETVGGRLFDRTKNAVQLTELGRVMLPNFRQVYDSATQAGELARRFTREHREVVRVGVMCTVDFEHLLPGFMGSQDEPGAIELRFCEGSFESLTDALDRGDIDLGIMCSAYEIPKRFKTTTLFSEDYVVAVGGNHRFNGRSHIEMTELHREHYCERMMCEFSTYIGRLLEQRGIDLDVVHQSEREDWIQTFVRADFGVAFMPLSIARAAKLGYVLTSDCPIVRNVGVFLQGERPVTKNQQLVIDLLAAHDWGRTAVAVRS
ncbi:MAG: LysR family transcriptional regulator [Roseiflexaceae bacterium]|nr:LysR family transcriptional regulator [Roseiflexaceae bacterium]